MISSRILRVIVLGVVALSLVTAASARLFETRQQCEARYGGVTETTNTPLGRLFFYGKDDYLIIISYSSNVAVMISYLRFDGEALSDPEIQNLLSFNSGGEVWYRAAVPNVDKSWQRSDGEAMAVLEDSETQIQFMSSDAVFKAAKHGVKEVRPQMDGF